MAPNPSTSVKTVWPFTNSLKDELLASDLGKTVQRARRARIEWEAHDDVRAGGLTVQGEEVVVVDACRDRLAAGVLEPVLEHQRVLDEPQRLSIDVGIAGRVAELVDELNSVRAFPDGPLAGIDDLVGLKPAVGRFLRLADGAHANSTKLSPGFASA